MEHGVCNSQPRVLYCSWRLEHPTSLLPSMRGFFSRQGQAVCYNGMKKGLELYFLICVQKAGNWLLSRERGRKEWSRGNYLALSVSRVSGAQLLYYDWCYSIMIGEVTYHEGKKPFWRRVGAIRNPRWGRWRDLLLVIPPTDGVTLLFFVGCLTENNALQEYLPSLPDENDDFVSNLSPSFLSSSPLSHLSHIFFLATPWYIPNTHTHAHTHTL